MTINEGLYNVCLHVLSHRGKENKSLPPFYVPKVHFRYFIEHKQLSSFKFESLRLERRCDY